MDKKQFPLLSSFAPKQTKGEPPAKLTFERFQAAFQVRTRAVANKLTKILFGPNGRTWIGRPVPPPGDIYVDGKRIGRMPSKEVAEYEGVWVGYEQGEELVVKGWGKDWTQALVNHAWFYYQTHEQQKPVSNPTPSGRNRRERRLAAREARK